MRWCLVGRYFPQSYKWDPSSWGCLHNKRLVMTTSSSEGCAPNPYKPLTWPKDLTADDIKHLLRNVISSAPNYESLEMLFRTGDYKSLDCLLKAYTTPQTPNKIDVGQFLRRHLGNGIDSAPTVMMTLEQRAQQLDLLEGALSSQLGSDQRNIAFISSPRGTGKTEFLKWFVFMKRAEAVKCGRVIVRCCDKSSHDTNGATPSWMHLVCRSSSDRSAPANSTDEGLCALIRTHVESVTGNPQDPTKYNNPQSAYATWMSETARHFNIPAGKKNVDPLIILDTAELLSQHDDHQTPSRKSSGKLYTLLESFCLAVPDSYSIFVMGCNANIDTADQVLNRANVRDVGSLPPLSLEGSRQAFEASWQTLLCGRVDFSVVHCLTGGVPRLLRWKLMKECSAVNERLDWFISDARARYPVDPAWFAQAYTCLLVSSTKARVRGSDQIVVHPAWRVPITPMTYQEAMTKSIGSLDPSSCLFLMPAATFVDETSRQHSPPIQPSDLHPFLSADALTKLATDEDRVRAFVPAFLHAVYARYLLASWESDHPWVSLEKVFEDAVRADQAPLLKQYEVNLSCGVVAGKVDRGGGDVSNMLTYCAPTTTTTTAHASKDAPHDASLWCRDRTTGETFALPLRLLYNAAHCQQHLDTSARFILCVDLSSPFISRPPRTSHTTLDPKVAIMIQPDFMCSVAWMLFSPVNIAK
ncbi:Bodo-specific multi-copy gene family, putative [Bodo saltans]|uniref:Bodo-specific multi-copy gene family, putative n=1 Tax=Bodo saltans TaxID=75058 RepID=A0A0S4JT21_BODSA|nr:Bodo-specific multi-copy gene family, putative [Bodo saltans]|eukprot:CUG92548.1 Bodo-specific multi-copy gene family, putative [Bodo saltans]